MYPGSVRIGELVGVVAPESDVLDADFLLTLGGGWFKRLVLSIGCGGAGGGEDEDGVCWEMLLIVGVFDAVLPLLVFPLGGGENEFVAGGGGGMTRLVPFDGMYAVPSASAEE